MEVKPGYKQTEVGVIPEEWEVRRLDDATEQQRPISYGIVQTGANLPNGVPCLRVVDISDGIINKRELIRTSKRISDSYRRTILKTGDLVMPLRGKVGDVGIVDAELEGANLTRGVALLAIRKELSAPYCRQFISWSATRKQLEQSMNGSALQEIPIASLRSFTIALPSSDAEQRAIAEALSDVDGLLGGLDRLIAKKRDLKQAAMQQLLTGQTRLPGFHGEWEFSTFGKVVRHHAGNSTLIKGKLAQSPAAGLFPGFSASGQDVWCDRYEYEGKAIIVSAVGSRCGKAFPATGKWCAIANTHVVWPNENKVDGRFLGLFINDEDFWLKSGSGQPFVLFKQTFARPLRLPPKAEQTAISEVLTEMGLELAALEQRREKTRALKQAMMQELLTGKTRLV